MTLAELIEQLQQLQAEHGPDLPVRIAVTTGPDAWKVFDVVRVRLSTASGMGARPRGRDVHIETETLNSTIRPTT